MFKLKKKKFIKKSIERMKVKEIEETPEQFIKKLIIKTKDIPISQEKQKILEKIKKFRGKHKIEGTIEEIEETLEEFLNKMLDEENALI